jgi:hypothetical protein
MARSHHCEKGSKDAPESQEVKLSGLTQPLPALSLAPKRGASLSSSHVLSASAPIANTRASGCAGLRVSETSSINTLPSAVSPPMLKPQTAGSHLCRRIESMSAKILSPQPVGVVDFSQNQEARCWIRHHGELAGRPNVACSRTRPVALHGAADVGDATAVRGGRPVGRTGHGSDGSERAAEVTAPA